MKMYISHSRNFDYKADLYSPLEHSSLMQHHEFIFPHSQSGESFHIKELFKSKSCDLIIAEVSFPSTGQGIELGWANIYEVPIVCIYKSDASIANSLRIICQTFIEYSDKRDMIAKLKKNIDLPFESRE